MARSTRRRRSRRRSGLGGLGQVTEILRTDNLKEVATVGATAVAGQLVTQAVVDQLAPLVAGRNADGTPKALDPSLRAVLEVVVGLLGGGVIWSLARNPKLGMSFALGPIVENGTRQVARLIAGTGPISGLARRPLPMGDIVPLPNSLSSSLGDVVAQESVPRIGSSLITA